MHDEISIKRVVREIFIVSRGKRGIQGEQGDPGQGVPSGGTTGEVLKKASNADYDTEWGEGAGTVDSVNGQTGVVVLDTDDIAEGASNFFFTNERAQDAVGNILTDTTTINFTYNDALNTIIADVIDGSIGDAKLGTGINATKIADGSISNTEFQFLNGVSSGIQTQLDAKADDATTISAGTGLTGGGVTFLPIEPFL